MSFDVTKYVWKHSPHNGSELLMLLAIADHANDEGVAWPSIPTLAERCRVGKRMAIYILQKLERAGSIAIEQGRGRGNSSVYTVNMEKGAICCTLSTKGAMHCTNSEEKVQSVAPITEEKVQSVAQKGAMHCTRILRDPTEQDLRALSIENSAPQTSDEIPPAKQSDVPQEKPAKARGSRFVPSTWIVTDELRKWASEAAPGVNIDYQTSMFVDHEFAQPYTHWDQAWKNWIRRAATQYGQPQPLTPKKRGVVL